jgi:hypothetical protein
LDRYDAFVFGELVKEVSYTTAQYRLVYLPF